MPTSIKWLLALLAAGIVLYVLSLTIKTPQPDSEFIKTKIEYKLLDSAYKAKYDSLADEYDRLVGIYDSLKVVGTKTEREYETLTVTRKVYLNAPIESTTAHVDSFRNFVSEFRKGE